MENSRRAAFSSITSDAQVFDALLKFSYVDAMEGLIPLTTPLLARMRPRESAFIAWAATL